MFGKARGIAWQATKEIRPADTTPQSRVRDGFANVPPMASVPQYRSLGLLIRLHVWLDDVIGRTVSDSGLRRGVATAFPRSGRGPEG